MEDGVSIHTANHTQQWLERYERNHVGFRWWPKALWPGNSGDLNPIEGFWPLLQGHVTPPTKQIVALSQDEMESRVVQWFAIRHVISCKKALRGMPGRLLQLRRSRWRAIGH